MWYKRIVSLFGWFVLMAAFLYACCRYVFPFKEQLQMFQATSQYAMETLGRAGGLALYLSEFVAQFYVVLWTGPFVTALLLTIITFLTTRILWQINRRDDLPLLACLPCLALLFLQIHWCWAIIKPQWIKPLPTPKSCPFLTRMVWRLIQSCGHPLR